MALSEENILWEDGQENMGSIRTVVFWALHGDIANFPSIPSLSGLSNLEDAAKLTGDFTFSDVSKKFGKLYCTEDTGMVESEGVGEKDGRSFKNRLKIFHPGSEAQALGFLRLINNSGGVFIAENAEGVKYVVGSEHFPAKVIEGSFTTTETSDGRKGFTMTVECASRMPAPIFEGNFPVIGEDSSSASASA